MLQCENSTCIYFYLIFDASDSIVPSGSHYQVTPKGIDITLKKASLLKWKMLERNRHRAPLSNSSINSNVTNHVSGSNALTNRKASSGSSSNDNEMNDLDAVDDDASPTSTVTQTLSSQSQPPPTTNNQTGQTGLVQEGEISTSTSDIAETRPPNGEPMQNVHTNPLYTPPTICKNCQHAATSSSHVHACVPPSELEMADPNYRYEQLRQPSLTGLVNLGNTCFMNSVLQCLSNTPQLRDYFVSGRYLANINADNPLGFEGKLAKCFSVILRKLWSGEYKYFSPKNLMEIVAKRSKNFDGHSQHDTHEFMSYLIDGLHEDLNRVRQKPITKPVEMENHPDRFACTVYTGFEFAWLPG